MPYQLEWEAEGVVFRFSGVVTGDDLLASNKEVYQDPRLLEIQFELCDLSSIERLEVSAEIVRELARLDEQAARKNPHVHVAIIASEVMIKGLVSMYALNHEAVGGTWVTEIFEDEAAARIWLMAN